MSEKQFDVGDRVFSHYEMDWGTIVEVDETYRDRRYHGDGDFMPDTTWYEVRFDKSGGRTLMDDAHGNWDMARIVPEHIAIRYGYGSDPHPAPSAKAAARREAYMQSREQG